MTIPPLKTVATSCANCRHYLRARQGGYCVYAPRSQPRSPSAQCEYNPSRFRSAHK